MPPQGCRLILASDGLWDLMSYSKAVTMTRSKPTSAATQALIQVGVLAAQPLGTVCITDRCRAWLEVSCQPAGRALAGHSTRLACVASMQARQPCRDHTVPGGVQNGS